MDKNKIKVLFLGLILIIGIFLRAYRLPDRMVFDWDQERDANAVKTILQDHKPLLIGPRIMNDSGFMLGPYFFYLLVPFYFVFNFHPYATVAFVIVYSFLFLLACYLIIKKITSENTALIFCAVWALLPEAINIDTIAWNPLLVPFFVILFIYLLNKEPSTKISYWLVLGLILGIGINIHVQLGILFFLFIFYFADKQKIKTNLKYFPLVFLGFVISFLPLIIFDIRHNWLNSNLIIGFLKNTSVDKYILSFVPIWGNFVKNVFGFNSFAFPIIIWLIVGIIFIAFSKGNKILKSIGLTWFIWPIIFVFYGKRPSEYYFNFTLIFIVLATSILISKFINKTLLLLLAFIIISGFLIESKINHFFKTPFSLAYKLDVVNFIKSKVKDNKFNISYSVPAGYNAGYNYLLESIDSIPTNNPDDPLIQIVIPPTPDNNKVFGGIGIQLPETFLP